jgi:hypothetical protein
LHFHSDHYFLVVGAFRLRLPRCLEPGALTISHVDLGGDAFAFVLALRHPLFGEIMRQTGVFHELLRDKLMVRGPRLSERAGEEPAEGA